MHMGAHTKMTLVAFVALVQVVAGSVLWRPQVQDLTRPRIGGYRQTLHNFQNTQYFANFFIGGQRVSGIFDTGSFELLVRSTRCQACVHPTPPYNRQESESYHKNGTMTKHVFGSGPCISVMGYENVTVGPGMQSTHQAFWEIVQHRIQVLDTARFAAIVGIGPNFAYGNAEKTLLKSLGIEEFSICLQRPAGSVGFLTWGPEIAAPPRSELYTAKVIGKHHWATRLSNVSFGVSKSSNTSFSQSQIPCGVGDCVAIIDSGTSLIAAPGIALMQLSEMIPKIQEDCSNLHELPDLYFTVDGNSLVLPPEAYVMRVTGATIEADDVWDLLFFKPKIRKVDVCMPAFMQIDMMSQNGPVWILGMPFFRYYHTTFDRKNQEVRFAQAGHDCEPMPLRNQTGKSLLATDSRVAGRPMDIDVDAIISPSLSGMIDFPFSSAGEIPL